MMMMIGYDDDENDDDDDSDDERMMMMMMMKMMMMVIAMMMIDEIDYNCTTSHTNTHYFTHHYLNHINSHILSVFCTQQHLLRHHPPSLLLTYPIQHIIIICITSTVTFYQSFPLNNAYVIQLTPYNFPSLSN